VVWGDKVNIGVLVVSAVVSLLGGKVALSELVENVVRRLLEKALPRLFKRPPSDLESPATKLKRLSETMVATSQEFDVQLRELEELAKARHGAVQALEETMKSLTTREQQLQERIKQLENVPIPVAEYFAQLASGGERKSARRDYFLFAAGVVVSVAVAIGLHAFGFT
jgi:chromosome segregation ATPase